MEMLRIAKDRPFINITIFLIGVFSSTCIWMGLAFPPAFMYLVGAMAGLWLFVLFSLHLAFAVFRRAQRTEHLTTSLLIIAFLAGFLFLFPRLVESPERRWFFQSGRQSYELMVERIRENKSMLTSKWRPLSDIVG